MCPLRSLRSAPTTRPWPHTLPCLYRARAKVCLLRTYSGTRTALPFHWVANLTEQSSCGSMAPLPSKVMSTLLFKSFKQTKALATILDKHWEKSIVTPIFNLFCKYGFWWCDFLDIWYGSLTKLGVPTLFFGYVSSFEIEPETSQTKSDTVYWCLIMITLY